MAKKRMKYYHLIKPSGREILVVAPSEHSVRASALKIGNIVRIDRLDKNTNYLHTVWKKDEIVIMLTPSGNNYYYDKWKEQEQEDV